MGRSGSQRRPAGPRAASAQKPGHEFSGGGYCFGVLR